MTPLTADYSLWTKWVLPCGAVVLIALWQLHDRASWTYPHYLATLVACATLLAAYSFMLKRVFAGRADEVLDGGAFLQVRHGRETELVPFSQIERIECTTGPTEIRIFLRAPGHFGSVISFYPSLTRTASHQNAVYESLKARLVSAPRDGGAI
jgi:hypothetical protein